MNKISFGYTKANLKSMIKFYDKLYMYISLSLNVVTYNFKTNICYSPNILVWQLGQERSLYLANTENLSKVHENKSCR